MVSSATIMAMGVTALVSLILPIALSAYLCVSKKLDWRPLLTGLSVFSATQGFFRMPLLNAFSETKLYAGLPLWVLGVILALSAALLENWGRYLGARFFAKGCSSYRDGVAYGLGHGGVEAFIVMGMNSFNNLYLALSVNSGRFEEMVASATPEQAAAVRSVLTETPAVEFLLGGVERVMVMIIQIALSIVVFYAIRTGRKSYVWAAVGAHFLVDFPIVLLQNGSVWVAEGFIALCAAAAVVVIVKMKSVFAKTPAAPSPAGR